MSSSAVELLKNIRKNADESDLAELAKTFNRADLLPHLFSIRGEPYTLDDYPQFKQMYEKQYAPNEIWMCGRQVAKSTNLSRSEVLDSVQLPNFQTLFVAPLQSQSQRYSMLYLKEAISTCGPAAMLQDKEMVRSIGRKGASITKSVMHQSFSNGATIQLTYAKTTSDRARGITADRIDFDEVQDQLTDHIPIISESLSNSAFGLRRFTGTAKTTDNTIEHLWKQSSQGEWAVQCTGCNHYNIPTRENNVLDMISARGPICTRCSKLLNVRDGSWVHAHTDRAAEFPGYHVPQIVLPAMVYDINKWSKIVDKIAKLPPSTIFTEILGISSDVGVRLITQKDIDDVSILGSHEELFKYHQNYAYRVLGVDWGIAEITSFTVAVVCGITHGGDIHVLYARRYVGQDIEETVHDIGRLSMMYKCDFVAPDFGVGYLNNALLRNRNHQVIQIMYVNQNKFLSSKEMHGNTLWTVDRNTALGVLFYNIRNKRMWFPNINESRNYTCDLLSPYEELVEKSSGMTLKKFVRDPAKPDDFCHALAFAMLVLYRLVQHPLLNVTPETSADFGGVNFSQDDNIDIDMLMQMSNNI